MRFISFFAGIGGFDLGLEKAGHECVGQVEIDNNCNKVLNYQYPNVKKFKDISKVDPDELPEADLYVGGFPCQDLSVGNKRRKGLDGKRSILWWEFIRCIENRNPTYIVAENVKGLLTSRKGKDMGIIIKSLSDRGYSCEWRVLDSQYFGVPQRRKRVFLVATHIDRHIGKGSYRPILFEQKGLSWNIGKDTKEEQKNTPIYGEDFKEQTVFIKTHRPNDNKDWEGWKYRNVHPTLTSFDIGEVRTIALVITKDKKIRRLNPVECERLQGFPDNWTQKGIDEHGNEVNIPESARYKQCGNAVTVNVAEWIGKRLKIMCGREDDREFWEWWYSLTPEQQEQHIGR